MEVLILKKIKYKISVCSSFNLAMLYCDSLKLTKKQIFIVRFFLELCLLSYNMIKYSPLVLAKVAVFLLCKIENLICEFQLEYEMKICAKELCCLIKDNSKNEVKKKYSSSKFYRITELELV